MKPVEYIEHKDEDLEQDDKVKTFKTLLRLSNITQFILAIFGIYIVITIEWSYIKAFMLAILAGYLFATLMMLPYLVQIQLKNMKK